MRVKIKKNNVVFLKRTLPQEVDQINYWAVSWCEELLGRTPTQADIDQAENYITELLMHFGEKFRARQQNS